MQQKHEELVSSLMDGESIDSKELDSCLADKHFQACWHRYHMVRDTMRGTLHSSSLTFDISTKISEAIAGEATYSQQLIEQPSRDEIKRVKQNSSHWGRLKEVSVKLTQLGLAACVTLAIITGVQYYQDQSNDNDAPALQTVPVGVSVSPVGGIPRQDDSHLIEKKDLDKHNELHENDDVDTN